MPRLPRFVISGQPRLVIPRGYDRAVIFVDDDDYRICRDRLKQAEKGNPCDIHAYVSFIKPMHLLLKPHFSHAALGPNPEQR